MRVLGPLYTSFAPTGAPALAELGHPDVASGRYSCAARSHGATTSPVSMSPREGALTSLRNHRNPLNPTFIPGKLSAVPHPSIPFPAPAYTLPKPSNPRLAPDATRTHYSTFPERGEDSRGEVGMFRRDIRVSEAERGRVPCRSKEHTASTRQKIKPQTIRSGVCGAADGNRTRVSGLGSVRSTIELQPHLFQCIAPACWG